MRLPLLRRTSATTRLPTPINPLPALARSARRAWLQAPIRIVLRFRVSRREQAAHVADFCAQRGIEDEEAA
jgi:hypothetical protein